MNLFTSIALSLIISVLIKKIIQTTLTTKTNNKNNNKYGGVLFQSSEDGVMTRMGQTRSEEGGDQMREEETKGQKRMCEFDSWLLQTAPSGHVRSQWRKRGREERDGKRGRVRYREMDTFVFLLSALLQ